MRINVEYVTFQIKRTTKQITIMLTIGTNPKIAK